MRKLILAALLLPVCAFAQDAMWKDGQSSIRLTKSACPVPVLSDLLKANDAKTEPKLALIMWQGMEVRACWAMSSEPGKILLADELGRAGFMPMDAFKPVPSV